MLKHLLLLYSAYWIFRVESFVPAKLLTQVINQMDTQFNGDFGKQSDTIVHDEIIKRGIIQSVVRYFYDQPNGSQRIDLNKINNKYYDLTNLYFDYYGFYICSITLKDLIRLYFQPNVALVDLDSSTKDMPYAHFDAEKFNESNERVIQFTQKTYDQLKAKDYGSARATAGQILHTIQDFYSHSNWVEMGRTYLNLDIGTTNFSKLETAQTNDSNLCVSNCTAIKEECNLFMSIIVRLLNAVGYTTKFIICPLEYYQCTNNVVASNKLVSGYYTDQKLPDGTSVDKPDGLNKCSHGGILDASASKIAKGGMNKDSGYYLFSPHADLHLKAVALAVNHTELFFNRIRTNIGDVEFDRFLRLSISQSDLNYYNRTNVTCSASLNNYRINEINSFLFFILTQLLIVSLIY